MPRWLILTATHILVLSVGFAGGIYLLPILTAPPSPTEVALQNSASEAVYFGRFARDLEGSDLLHWGTGEVRIAPDRDRAPRASFAWSGLQALPRPPVRRDQGGLPRDQKLFG